jgi:hypothetical protein
MEESEGDKAFFVNVVAELRWWRTDCQSISLKRKIKQGKSKKSLSLSREFVSETEEGVPTIVEPV